MDFVHFIVEIAVIIIIEWRRHGDEFFEVLVPSKTKI
jgi:hypothetical protein